MKRIINTFLLIAIILMVFCSSYAFAWRYKFISEQDGAKKEIGLNGIGKIDSVSSDSIVIDDSAFTLPKEFSIKQLESGLSYPFGLKQGQFVGYELDKKRNISILYVINDEENYRKLKRSSE